MDTVVPGRGGRGGLLVMIDRCSRRYVAERIGHVSQDCVVRAIGRMRARGAPPVVRTVTTDNGCEFPGQRHLDGELGAEVYYTRAYASWEKGSVENCNRFVRRWYPKGTDFSRTSRREIRDLEDWINSMHRESLNGETAYDYDSHLAKKDYFLLTHYPCKLPSFFAIRTSGPPLCSLGRIWYNMRH